MSVTYHPPQDHPLRQQAHAYSEQARLRGERDDPRGLAGIVRDAVRKLEQQGLTPTPALVSTATVLPISVVQRHWPRQTL